MLDVGAFEERGMDDFCNKDCLTDLDIHLYLSHKQKCIFDEDFYQNKTLIIHIGWLCKACMPMPLTVFVGSQLN